MIVKTPESSEQQQNVDISEKQHREEPTTQTKYLKTAIKTIIPQQENTNQTTEQQHESNDNEKEVKEEQNTTRAIHNAKLHPHDFNTLDTATVIKLMHRKEQVESKVSSIHLHFSL